MVAKLSFTSFSMIFLATATVLLLADVATAQIINQDVCAPTKFKDICVQIVKNEKDIRRILDNLIRDTGFEIDRLQMETNGLGVGKEVTFYKEILEDARDKMKMAGDFHRDNKKPLLASAFRTALQDMERCEEGFVAVGKKFPFPDKNDRMRRWLSVANDIAHFYARLR